MGGRVPFAFPRALGPSAGGVELAALFRAAGRRQPSASSLSSSRRRIASPFLVSTDSGWNCSPV